MCDDPGTAQGRTGSPRTCSWCGRPGRDLESCCAHHDADLVCMDREDCKAYSVRRARESERSFSTPAPSELHGERATTGGDLDDYDEACDHECDEECDPCLHEHCMSCGGCQCPGYCDDFQTYNLRPAETGGRSFPDQRDLPEVERGDAVRARGAHPGIPRR